MAVTAINATDLLVRGLRTDFAETYARVIKDMEPTLGQVMGLNLPSNKISEIYGYFESPAHFRRWQRGEAIAESAFRGRTFTVPNYDWGVRIPWHVNDAQDDQSMSLQRRVQDAANDIGVLAERVFFQYLTGSTSNDLIPLVPVAPDGLNLFSSSTRFGATNGNSLTSSGVATTAAVQSDFYKIYAQFGLFQDTEGQPLWPRSFINQGVVVIYNISNEQVFRQAFNQLFVQGTSAGISNVVIDDGKAKVVTLWPTQRITNNAWFTFMTGAPYKAIFHQVRQAPVDYLETEANSDQARRYGFNAMQWKARFGFGIALPYQVIQNS